MTTAKTNHITDEDIEAVARVLAACVADEAEWRSHAADAKLAIASYRACQALEAAPKKAAKSFAEIKDDIKAGKVEAE